MSAFDEELIETVKKVNEYKEGCEANIVSILYKNPDAIFDTNLSLDEFNNNIWKVYWTIAKDIIKLEKKAVLDEITEQFTQNTDEGTQTQYSIENDEDISSILAAFAASSAARTKKTEEAIDELQSQTVENNNSSDTASEDNGGAV